MAHTSEKSRVFWPVLSSASPSPYPPSHAPREKGWRPRTELSVLNSLRSAEVQWAAKSPSGLFWAVPGTERTFPRSPRLGAGGQGPGLAWHPRRAPAALAAWPAWEGARPPRAEQGRREAAARPRPGIRAPSPRPGRRRPAQRLSGCAGTRRDAWPRTTGARPHEVTAGADQASAHRPGRARRAGPTRGRPGRSDFSGGFVTLREGAGCRGSGAGRYTRGRAEG